MYINTNSLQSELCLSAKARTTAIKRTLISYSTVLETCSLKIFFCMNGYLTTCRIFLSTPNDFFFNDGNKIKRHLRVYN